MRRLPNLAVLPALLLLLTGCSLLAPGPAVESDEDFGEVQVYRVRDDATLSPEPTGTAAQVWELFRRIATDAFTSEVMTQFRAGDAPDSDTLAYVYQDDDPEYWILAANLATAEDHDLLVATLIHEYAHVLTLSTEAVDPDGSCHDEDAIAPGWCLEPDSPMQAFHDEFWAGYGDDAPAFDNDDADIAWEFYTEHEDDFVSDYAATNSSEDIAETFAVYVMEDVPDDDTLLARKIRFFDDYPEFAAIRERIRAELEL